MWRRLCKCMVITSLMVLALSGCGKKEAGYDSGYITEEDVAAEIDTNAATSSILADRLGVEEKWVEEIDADYGLTNVFIEAQVNVPEASALKTISVAEEYFSDEDKEKFVDSLAEGDVYKADDQYLPKYMLEAMIEEQEYQIESAENDLEEHYPNDEYYQRFVDEKYAYLAELNTYLENASEDWQVISDYSGNSYRMTYNGTDYDLYFVSDESANRSAVYFEPTSRKEDGDYSQLFGIEDNDVWFDMPNVKGYKNTCEKTEEELMEEAHEFILSFDIGDFQCVDSYPLRWHEKSEEGREWTEGYYMIFWRSVDGVMVDGSDYSFPTLDINGEEIYQEGYFDEHSSPYGLEMFCVYIKDDMIIEFNYSAPIELLETTSEDTELLSYENIKEIMRQEIKSNPGHDEVNLQMKYNKMDFMYYRIKNSENVNEYTLVPVWRLLYNSAEETNNVVMVNAIDGSIIDVAMDRCGIEDQ